MVKKLKEWNHIGIAIFNATSNDRMECWPLLTKAEHSQLDTGRRVETGMKRTLSARKSDNALIKT
jgi:hypothetical protein